MKSAFDCRVNRDVCILPCPSRCSLRSTCRSFPPTSCTTKTVDRGNFSKLLLDFCFSLREPQVPLAVSILISSDFLQMQRLVAECLGFVGEHLTEIVKLPIDLSCLSDKMVLQLAKVYCLFVFYHHGKHTCHSRLNCTKVLQYALGTVLLFRTHACRTKRLRCISSCLKLL